MARGHKWHMAATCPPETPDEERKTACGLDLIQPGHYGQKRLMLAFAPHNVSCANCLEIFYKDRRRA